MIVQSINQSSFHDAFTRMGRENQFTYDGLNVLFDALQDLSESEAQQLELDVIGLCCEYRESTLDEVIADYSYNPNFSIDKTAAESQKLEYVENFISENTWLCGITPSNTFVYLQF